MELIQEKTAHLLSNGNQVLEAVSCAMGSNAGKTRDGSWWLRRRVDCGNTGLVWLKQLWSLAVPPWPSASALCGPYMSLASDFFCWKFPLKGSGNEQECGASVFICKLTLAVSAWWSSGMMSVCVHLSCKSLMVSVLRKQEVEISGCSHPEWL